MHFDQTGARRWAVGICKLVLERLFRIECARMHIVGENDDNGPEDLVVEPFANLTLLHAIHFTTRTYSIINSEAIFFTTSLQRHSNFVFASAAHYNVFSFNLSRSKWNWFVFACEFCRSGSLVVASSSLQGIHSINPYARTGWGQL